VTTTSELGGEGGGGLPSTGSGQGTLLAIGVLMVVAGVVTLVLARRTDRI
jgi:LPXTG-motif cell wall-anchored protein